jgi:hypothetical protein
MPCMRGDDGWRTDARRADFDCERAARTAPRAALMQTFTETDARYHAVDRRADCPADAKGRVPLCKIQS